MLKIPTATQIGLVMGCCGLMIVVGQGRHVHLPFRHKKDRLG